MKARNVVFALILLTIIVGGGVWISFRLRQIQSFGPVARRLPTELDAARREGVLFSPPDLRPAQRIPQSQNAAPLYLQIDAALRGRSKSVKDEDNRVNKLVRSKNPAEKELARQILDRRAKELALAEQAVERPFCRFDRQWELGPKLMLPEYASMREIARLLAARAFLESDSGNVQAAFRTISIGTRMGRQAGEDPIILAMLINVFIYTLMDSAFQEVALAHKNDPRAISLGSGAAAFPPLPEFEQAMRGEVVMGRVAANMVRRDPTTMEQVYIRLGGKPGRTREMMCDAWEVRLLEYWRECYRILRSNRGDHIGQANALRALGEDLVAREKEPTYELAAILMPVFSQVSLKLAAGEEQQRLRQTLLELVRFKQKSGRWPDALSELPTPPELDIFTGKPPIYRKTPVGFILYSVAENLKDDGGQSKRDKKTGAFDLVVQYPRPIPTPP